MKFETELFKASIGLADGMSYRALTRYDFSLLDAFYRSLNQEERRLRFGGAVSDEAIARYCAQIEWRSTLMIGLVAPHGLLAVSTNVRVDIRRVENATVATTAGQEAISILLRLSAVATREIFAADRMLVDLDDALWLRRHLPEIGPATLSQDYVEFDVTAIGGEISLEGNVARRQPRDAAAVAASSCGY